MGSMTYWVILIVSSRTIKYHPSTSKSRMRSTYYYYIFIIVLFNFLHILFVSFQSQKSTWINNFLFHAFQKWKVFHEIRVKFLLTSIWDNYCLWSEYNLLLLLSEYNLFFISFDFTLLFYCMNHYFSIL